MKIYQLHEHGGEWEDSYDYIRGSYLRKERAEEEKVKAEAKEKQRTEQGRKCNNCPFLSEHPFENIEDLLSKYADYCDETKLEQTDYGISCKNYFCYWDEPYFKIEEVEVEE